MKKGRYVSIGHYKNVKIGYGTIDYINLKTIYLKFNSWILPEINENYDLTLSKTRSQIKRLVYDINNEMFHKDCIVDIDIRTNGIKPRKKSFMNLEITLFVKNNFDIKSIKPLINEISTNVIDNTLLNKPLFNFYKNKMG